MVGVIAIGICISGCDNEEDGEDYRKAFVGYYKFRSHHFAYTVNPYNPDTFDLGYTYSSGYVSIQKGSSTGIAIDYQNDFPLILTSVSPGGILADTIVDDGTCPHRFVEASFQQDTLKFRLSRFPCNNTQHYFLITGMKLE